MMGMCNWINASLFLQPEKPTQMIFPTNNDTGMLYLSPGDSLS